MLSKLTFEVDREYIEKFYDALFIAGINSYSVYDYDDFAEIVASKSNWDYIDDSAIPKSRSRVRVEAVLDKGESAIYIDRLTQSLESLGIGGKSFETSISDCQNADWHNEWKKHYAQMDIGRFRVIPYWEENSGNESRIPILINPSMAFGTGEHESTKIALMLLSLVDLNEKLVLDIGTGSGILGIAAIKSGARFAEMVDIDENSIANAKENAILNKVQEKTNIHLSVFLSEVNRKFDIVTSNMTSSLNLKLLPELEKAVRKNSLVILSGVLEDGYEEVVKSFEKSGYMILNAIHIGEWVGILLKKEF